MKTVLQVCDFDPTVVGRLRRLEEHDFRIVVRTDLAGTGREDDLIAALGGAWGVLAGNERYTRRVMTSTSGLRVIARPGVGYDNVDVPAATDVGIAALITPGTNHDAVAEFTVGLMLATTCRIAASDRVMRRGGWRIGGLGRGMYGSTVGLVGLGLIGRAVVERLAGFGCRILAAEPNADQDFCARHGVELVTLEQLLRESDVVSLHVPLTTETSYLINRERLSLMRRHAVLINTSRGAVVDEQALVMALRDESIGGAGLDVFETEPLPPGSPLTQFDTVVVTGHVAAHTTDAMIRMVDAAVDGILAVAEGWPPEGCLNPEVFDQHYVSKQRSSEP
jgi:phosphoglycerate dehydrogenase-like enzyme